MFVIEQSYPQDGVAYLWEEIDKLGVCGKQYSAGVGRGHAKLAVQHLKLFDGAANTAGFYVIQGRNLMSNY